MSAALYRHRLYWAGMRGYALHEGRMVRLSEPPRLPGLPALRIDAIDYCPDVQVAMVMEVRSGWRDLKADEIRAAQLFLQQTVPADAPEAGPAPGATAGGRR